MKFFSTSQHPLNKNKKRIKALPFNQLIIDLILSEKVWNIDESSNKME